MANRRFIDFPIATTVGANDIILIWQDGLNKQTTKATILSGLPEDLEDLADVNISGLTNGQILRYDSTTGKWVNTDQGNLDLGDLNDVSIVSPSNGQVLVYNSSTSKWENSSAGFVPYTGAVTTVNLGAQTIQAGAFVKAGGTSAQFLKADGSVDSNTYGTGTVTSVGLTMPAAFSVANSPVTTAGTLAVTGAGTTAQYIRGDGTLATFPALTGFVPYTGATADVNLGTHDLAAERGTFENNGSSNTLTVNHTSGSGYGIIVTKGGNNEALYVSKTSGSGNAMTVVGGRTSLVDLALSSVTNTAGDFLTLSGGVVHKRTAAEVRTDIGAGTGNGTVTSVAALTLGTSGTDLSSTVANGTTTPVITLNVPTASASNRGALSAADWSTFNGKENAITAGTTAQYFRGDKTFQTLNTSVVPELTNLYYTEARVNANTNVAANTAARHNAVTIGTANGLSLSTQVLSLGLASAGVTGALSGTDWSTFNSKQNALTNPVTGTGTTNYLAKFTGSTTVGNSQVFDNGTNVGIATTPSAWAATALQINNVGLAARPADSSLMQLSVNQYWDGSNHRYISSNFASLYTQNVGGHNWSLTSSGTAGNVITWNTVMTLTNSGNLLVGTETDSGFKLDVNGTGRFSNSLTSGGKITSGQGAFRTGGFYVPYSTASTASRTWAMTSDEVVYGDFGIITSSTQTGDINTYRIYINPSGNVGIGTTTPTNYTGYRTLSVNNTSGGVLELKVNDASALNIFSDSAQSYLYEGRNLPIWFATNTIERFRISSTGFVSAGAVTNGRLGVRGFTNDSSGYAFEAANSSGNTLFVVRNDGVSTFTGNVGIGTFSPGDKLHVANNGTGAYSAALWTNSNSTANLYVGVGGSAVLNTPLQNNAYVMNAAASGLAFGTSDAVRMFITSGGNVLIGSTSDPGYRLFVNGNTYFRTGGNTSGSFGFVIQDSGANNLFLIRNDGQATFSSSVTAESTFFGKNNAVYQNSSTFILNVGSDQAMYGGTNSDGGVFVYGNNKLHLSTNSVRRLTIDGSGNVGIGTTAPTPHFGGNALIIQGLSGSRGIMEIWDNSGTGGKAVFQQVGGDTYVGNLAKGSGSGDLFLTANGSISTSFKANGNVLIGTSTDVGAKLYVEGAIRTGAPSGGSAVNWKLGTSRGGTVTTNATVRVEIDGVLVDLVARYV